MKTLCIRVTATLGCLAMAGAPLRSAHADLSVADKAMATQLFKEGRALFEQGRYPEACQKLEESQRIEPGGGTLLNLALCHERQGRSASAWVEFTDALAIAKHDDNAVRAEFARSHIAQIEPTLSRLTVQVPQGVDAPDLEIRRDGSLLGRAAWGSPIPVDPGDHVIEASAGGKVTWRQNIFVAPNGDTKLATVPVLEDAPVAASPSGDSSARTSPGRDTDVAPRTSTRRHATEHDEKVESSPGTTVPAWVALGLGAAAAGVGTYFGIRAISEKSDADKNCPHDVCNADGANQNSDAIRFGNYSTGFIAGGAAGVAAGIVLFLVRPGAHAQTETGHHPVVEVGSGDVAAVPGGAALRVSGTW